MELIFSKVQMKTNILKIRNKFGLTQAELAHLLGLGNQTRVAEYENGSRNPSRSIQIILQLLDSKKISINDLKKIAAKSANP